jgi:cell division protein FtsB
MTISHSKPNFYVNKIIRLLSIAFVLGCALMVFLYNQNTKSRQEVSKLTKEVDALRSDNTQLKNDLHGFIDSRMLTAQVERLGYIKESMPTYITLLADGSVREDGRVSLLRP